MAKEIMREAQSGGGAAVSHNAHLAEERGMEVDDSGVSHGLLLFATVIIAADPMPVHMGTEVLLLCKVLTDEACSLLMPACAIADGRGG